MNLVTSNYPPVVLSGSNFSSVFEEMVSKSDNVQIATGYVSAEAIVEVEAIVRANRSRHLGFELVLGMHKFDGFTQQQYESSVKLHNYLQSERLGEVRVCTTFPYHGKVFIFSNRNNGPFSGTVGSSNLSGILATHGIYETDVLVTDKAALIGFTDLFAALKTRASRPIDELPQPEYKKSTSKALDNIKGVNQVTEAEVRGIESSIVSRFTIPIKSDHTPKSNLNAYFGKGRENTRTGFVRPRHWYEVELIVPKSITQREGYPKNRIPFNVITDDGWSFECTVNGDNSKNFRSSRDLQILGRWLKGRLEDAGCLKVGGVVTQEVLNCYGRSDFYLSATNDPNLWYLDFSR